MKLTSSMNIKYIKYNVPISRAYEVVRMYFTKTVSLCFFDSITRCVLFFSAAPKFVEKLLDAEVNEGKKAVIDCVVTGEPEPDIEWTFEGKPLKESNR